MLKKAKRCDAGNGMLKSACQDIEGCKATGMQTCTKSRASCTESMISSGVKIVGACVEKELPTSA